MLSTKSIFLDLTESELAAVHGRCRKRQLQKRESVIQQGDSGDEMFIVEQGRLKMTAVSPEGKEIAFGILEAGDTFGEMAMLDGERRSATITAMERCELLALSRAAFKALIVEQPEIAIRIMVILSHRLRHTSRLYEDSVFMEVPGRLAQFLLEFSDATEGRNGAPGPEISLSQYELGTLVNASRESVNKLLKDWEEQGMIELGRNRIRILDHQGLVAQVQN